MSASAALPFQANATTASWPAGRLPCGRPPTWHQARPRRFVTPKASDTFYTNAVFEKIAARNLDADTMYRIDRHDISIDSEAIWNLPDDALLEKIESLPPRHMPGSTDSPLGTTRTTHQCCGDFTLMSAAYWRTSRPSHDLMAYRSTSTR